MWFSLSLLALIMLSSRRTAEKKAAVHIDSMAMAWLQQAVAIPFIFASLFFAKFYWPNQLPISFWELLIVYIALQSIYLYCYYRAISIADISYVAPLMTLFSVGNIIGAYFILGQIPSASGFAGAIFIVSGAWIIARSKQHKDKASSAAHNKALTLVLVAIVACSIFSNLEVLMLRDSNPTSYNFYSSILTIPFVILVSIIMLKTRLRNSKEYWKTVRNNTQKNIWPLIIVGVTYTVNMLATYQAKIIAPNQAYVSTIKAASVLPIVFIGMFFFKEKVNSRQWFGIACMLTGLVLIALNI